MILLQWPYLLFLGDIVEPRHAKTAYGLRDWVPERCVGEWTIEPGKLTTGLPAMNPVEARRRGARSLVIGAAPVGGAITEAWIPSLLEALEAGLDIVAGLHSRLNDNPGLKRAADRLGRVLIDVRTPPALLPTATGRKRSGRRLLTVGTDCALGKKYTALAIARAFQARGVDCDFRATGQTGIMISGGGIPIDAVVGDFIAGAAEILSPDAKADHWDVIEGQGSILHPAYSGVSLGLLHGSQPDVLVMCHEAGRETVLGFADYSIPAIGELIEVTLQLARRTNPQVRCGGVSLNTANLTESAAARALSELEAQLGLPCADPLRGGAAVERLIRSCLA